LVQARNLFNVLMTEHDNYLVNVLNSQFSIDENNSIHHANIHFTSLETTGQESQKTATLNALEEM